MQRVQDMGELLDGVVLPKGHLTCQGLTPGPAHPHVPLLLCWGSRCGASSGWGLLPECLVSPSPSWQVAMILASIWRPPLDLDISLGVAVSPQVPRSRASPRPQTAHWTLSCWGALGREDGMPAPQLWGVGEASTCKWLPRPHYHHCLSSAGLEGHPSSLCRPRRRAQRSASPPRSLQTTRDCQGTAR